MTNQNPPDVNLAPDFRKVLYPWKDEAITFLVNNLREMFKSADQVLLEFADKAQNNKIQSHFFEAMRELWLKQDNVISIFQDGLERNIFRFRETSLFGSLAADGALSLVDKDSFERNLALQTIANQAEKKHYSTLYELTQRLAIINNSKAVSMENIPASPKMLAELFEKCVEVIFVEKEVRMVLYTLFDRFVISKAIKCYDDLNQRLISAGILPDLKPNFVKSAATPEPKKAPPHPEVKGLEVEEMEDPDSVEITDPYKETASSSQIAAETFDRIKDLLAHQRAQKIAARKQKRRSSDQNAPQPPPASRQDVVTAISDQGILDEAPLPEIGVRDTAIKRVEVDAQLILNINDTLKKQRELIKKLVGQDRIPAEDEDVIDIVGLIFEMMLNDKELCNEVKTLLSHLHTPYLKIAVADPSFLTEHEHAARRLFELMIATGRDWVDPSDLTKGIYPQIQVCVNTIIKEKTFDEQLFNKLAMDLTEANALLSDKQRISEDRTVEVEKGRAKLNQAKDIALDETRQLMENKILIEDADQFLNGPWLDYLTLVLLRSDFNANSDSWNQALSLCKKIIQFSLSSKDPNGGMPSLQAISDLSQEMHEIVCSLIPHYQAEIDNFLAALGDSAKRGSSYAIHHADTSDIEESEVNEALEAQVEILRNVEPGTWFNLNPDGTETMMKVKMSWYNPVTANFLFVNQSGVKAAVKNIRQLAKELIDGKAEMFEKSGIPFIDRSFKAIRSLLEKTVH